MTVLGLIILLIGLVIGSSLLFWIGVIVAIVGAVLWLRGDYGPTVGRRRHYW